MGAPEIQAAGLIYGIIIWAMLKIADKLEDDHNILQMGIHLFVVFSFFIGAGWVLNVLGSTGTAMFNAIRWFVYCFVTYVFFYTTYQVFQPIMDLLKIRFKK